MKITQYTAPTSEPISLSDLRLHLKIDSGAMTDAIMTSPAIAPGSHAVTTGFTLQGTSIAVTADTALVQVDAGTCGTGGTVDVKIQESLDGEDWADWTGGAFTAITTENDNAIHEKEYTGTMAYIRPVAQVIGAACDFGVTVTQYEPVSDEDSVLTGILATARGKVEGLANMQLMPATWDYILDDWPAYDYIKLPKGNLSTVTSIIYKDVAGTETTLTEDEDYLVETNGVECGRIVLPDGGSWPNDELYPSNPITIRFTCGYTTVPYEFKVAVLLFAQALYERKPITSELIKTILEIIPHRLHDEF